MKNLKLKIKTTFTLLAIIACSYQAHAQVTVGSNNPPAKAALLEIKNIEPNDPASPTDANNITVNDKGGGLGLPRVKLVNINTLQPFIPTGTDWTNNTDKVKEKHAGLMVYNIYVSPDGEDADKTFSQGIYVWDGAKWKKMMDGTAQRYFYMPSFTIKLVENNNPQTCDLYAEYKKQFTNDSNNPLFVSSNASLTRIPSPEKQRLYAKDELDYAITYYDTNIINNVSIDEDGVMTYDVVSVNTNSNSFVNIVFIVK
ncbi:MAG: hypothetical protein LBV71_17730 [Prevotella sp.]|jgi:hypothetical protein|nr:hypothetical protein [Prevotella sp.]